VRRFPSGLALAALGHLPQQLAALALGLQLNVSELHLSLAVICEHRAASKRGDGEMPPLVPPVGERTPDQEAMRGELFAVACLVAELTSEQRRALIVELAAQTGVRVGAG